MADDPRAGPVEWRLQCDVRRVAADRVEGHVFDPDDPDRRFVVELSDRAGVRWARADRLDARLLRQGVGDGRYGFAFRVDDSAAGDPPAEVRIANMGVRVGVALRQPGPEEPRLHRGGVRWLGGLSFTGWLGVAPAGPAPRVRAIVDECVVAEVAALRRAAFDPAQGPDPVNAFDLTLPDLFADGRAHSVEFIADDGAPIDGSPLSILAASDALMAQIEAQGDLKSERERLRAFESRFPRSAPFSRLDEWLERFAPPAPAPIAGRVAAVVLGADGVEATVESLAASAGADWIAAAFETGADGVFDADDLRAFLDEDAAEAAMVLMVAAGARLAPDALLHFLHALAAPDAALAYADLIVETKTARIPLAFGAFDRERQLEQGGANVVFALPPARLRAALDAGAASSADVVLAVSEQTDVGRGAIVHAPAFLASAPHAALPTAAALRDAATAHLARCVVEGEATAEPAGLFARVAVRRRAARETLSIVIPSSGDVDQDAFVETLRASAAPVEVDFVVVDRAGTPRASGSGVQRVPAQPHWRDARLWAAGAAAARGRRLLFMPIGLRPLGEDWLAEMLGRLEAPAVSAVGGLICDDAGVVRSAGHVHGAGFGAVPAFADHLAAEPGYADLLGVARECLSVSPYGLLTRRADFEGCGGFDAATFPTFAFGIDYCLRLREKGRRTLFTPRARFALAAAAPALGPLTTGGPGAPATTQAEREANALRRRWPLWMADDPLYPPSLSLDERPFAALAWPPRLQPR